MLNPIQYPTGRCFLNKVPDIVMTAGNNVRMSLWLVDGGSMSVVFDGRYQPDFNQRISIDISSIVKDYLKTTLPVDDGDIFQTGFETHFIIKADEDNSGGELVSDFYVLNASPNTTLTVEQWCASHFLTEQPVQKPTNYESPEWLTYFDYEGDWLVVGRFYPKEGNLVDMIVKWDEKPGCFSVNVNYARLIPHVARLPHQLKGFYDIIIFDGNMTEMFRQRYLYEERSGMEKYYLFANPLGGIDTLIAHGENVLQPELEHNIGRFGKLYKPLDNSEDMRQWQQNTGMMKYRMRNWLYGLVANKQDAAKYDPKTETYHPIVVNSSEIGMSDNGQLANATFSYIMADAGNVIDEEERYLSQSAADTAPEMDDLTTEATVSFTNGVTEEITVNAESVFVTFDASASPVAVNYYIDGVEAGSFTPGTDASPVIIAIPYGSKIQFETEGDIDSLTLNWYEGWQEEQVYVFSWGNTVCVVAEDIYTFSWSDPVCVKTEENYTFSWSDSICAIDSQWTFAWDNALCVVAHGGYEFKWSDALCALHYVFELNWEEIETQDNNN